jgi:hypothetical protein
MNSETEKYLSFAAKAGWIEKVVTIGFLVNPGPEFLPNVNLNVAPENEPEMPR